MKREDAELKVNALTKDLVEREAEHKGSKRKCIITALGVVARQEDAEDFDVACFFTPLEHTISHNILSEELDHFLSTYKILDTVTFPRQEVSAGRSGF